ncbi:MAG: GGDEF domain-containing protein [Actinobacteria bacterium]|nr:GGDEF domain-containing protein [Actinomycetota bacterium]
MGFRAGGNGMTERPGGPAPRACRFSHGAVTAAGLAVAAGIAVLDWAAGPAASLSVLSVFPVMAVAWCAMSEHAVVVAALAAGAGLVVDRGAAGVWTALALLAVLLTAAALPVRLRDALAHQTEAAATDPLTGALNRRAFQEAAERERLRAERRSEPISVAYLDLDGFKEVNDRHGHQTGDRVLEEVAEAVLKTIRGTDLFCRIGGDEFVLLLPDTDAREAAAVLNRARGTLGTPQAPVTSSVGIATFRIVPTTVGAMIDAADDLMYQAKRQGKNRIVAAVVAGPWMRWDPGDDDPVADTVTIDVEIVRV